MAGAIYLVHLPYSFAINNPEGPGYEYNAVLIGICLVLLLTGGGKLAADRMFRVRPRV